VPPAFFVAEATGATTGGANHQAFTTPAARKAGDAYIAAIVHAPGVSHLDFTQPGMSAWEEIESVPLVNATVILARRAATDSDPATLDLYVTNAGVWILSALIVYRGLDNVAAVVDADALDITTSTNFACPPMQLTTYSDLYIGIVGVTTAATAVTPPAGTSEKHEHAVSTRELEIFTFHAEAPGATGSKIATTAANQSGVVAALALATGPLLGDGKTFSLDPIGTIGLPVEGV
jgi:hypothetical protein